MKKEIIGYIHNSVFGRTTFTKEGHYNELTWRYVITKAKQDASFVKVKVTIEELNTNSQTKGS